MFNDAAVIGVDHMSSKDSSSANTDALRDERATFARIIVRTALWVIGGLSIAIVLAIAGLYIFELGSREPREAVEHLNTLLATILPLLGAWVGAVIAFYFARENFDAATRHTSTLLREIQPTRLETIPVGERMVPVARLEIVRTPNDNATDLDAILTRFHARGLSRIPILDANDMGLGVLHDSSVARLVIDEGKKSPPGVPTLATLLADANYQALLAASVVFVTRSAPLSKVKAEMDEKSKSSNISCRDVFVTDDGLQSGKVVGYLSDIDIANHGAFG